MFNKNSLAGLSIAVIICLICVFVYKFFIEKKDDFLLDNPTESSIKIIFNGEDYVLGPGQTLSVPVHIGENTISGSSEDGRVILKDTFFEVGNTNRGLINPTQSTYYTFRRYYGYIKNIDSLYKAHHSVIDGKEYIGEIKEKNNLLIQDFYFNINEKFPKVVNKADSMESRVKLFRKNQFLEFYQSSFE